MKKAILLIAIASSFIACKKGEISNNKIDEIYSNTDSIASEISNTIENEKLNTEKVLDSSQIKIKDFDGVNDELKSKIDATQKTIDSVSQKITNTKLESKTDGKNDSIKSKTATKNTKPKVIKETKIVYKEKPQQKNYELLNNQNITTKTGAIEINVDDIINTKDLVIKNIKKYDGILKSENLTSYNNEKAAFLKVKIPTDKFDYLIEDLSNNYGEITAKNIETSGYNSSKNNFCDVEITLTEYKNGAVNNNETSKTFGDKFFDAISSGWEVIVSIFLFILPFWPIFLVGGIIFYFYKKKNNTIQKHNEEDKNTK